MLRGGLLALCSAALAMAAHALAGGTGQNAGLAVPLTALIALAGIALADRQRGGPAILGALGISHAGEHLMLTTLAHHQHAAHFDATHFDATAMTAAHVAAVLLTAVLLTHAESAVFATAAALAMLLPRRPLSQPVPAAALLTHVADIPVDHVLDVLLRKVIGKRGPPLPG